MFELVYAFPCLDLQVYGGVLSRDAYETVGVTDDVRARLRALTCASARSSRIRRGDVTEWGPNDKNVVLVVRGRRAYGLPD